MEPATACSAPTDDGFLDDTSEPPGGCDGVDLPEACDNSLWLSVFPAGWPDPIGDSGDLPLSCASEVAGGDIPISGASDIDVAPCGFGVAAADGGGGDGSAISSFWW